MESESEEAGEHPAEEAGEHPAGDARAGRRHAGVRVSSSPARISAISTASSEF